MNSFLSRLGQIINAGSALVPFLSPLVVAFAPKTAPTVQNINDELPKIAAVIAQVEAVGQAMQLPGAKKVEIAAPLVAQIVLASSFMAGKKIRDQVLFAKGVTNIAGGMADCLNALDAAAAETETKVA